MSNKIATVGAALAGIGKKELQLVYAEPIEYNMDHYSEPGADVVYFKLRRTARGKLSYVG